MISTKILKILKKFTIFAQKDAVFVINTCRKITEIDMEHEIWRDIEGYEGLYQVSNLGRVKSLNYKRSGDEGILTPNPDKDGYLLVTLSKNGKVKWPKVHRLVSEAFIPNPEGKPEVDHINRDRTDNRASNLRWVTSRENKYNGVSKPILCVETGIVFPSAKEASIQTGAHPQNIYACCRGKYGHKTTKGYHWQYAENNEN